jgi:hypothetical protein
MSFVAMEMMSRRVGKLVAISLVCCGAAQAAGTSTQSNLQKLLNQVDTSSAWSRTPVAQPSPAQQEQRAINTPIANFLPTGVGSSGQPNPFNLSPFGMLHYMWDDTTYVSSTNPVNQYEVRDDLQIAQQDANLAESAERRAKYASDPVDRKAAAEEAQQYAAQAKAAYQRAQQAGGSGSYDPGSFLGQARDEVDRAQSAADRAQTAVNGWR